jgi:hypothetical protein
MGNDGEGFRRRRGVFFFRYACAVCVLLQFLAMFQTNFWIDKLGFEGLDNKTHHPKHPASSSSGDAYDGVKRRAAYADEIMKQSSPVGTFNDFDLYYVDAPPPKPKIHCFGENYGQFSSVNYRMCEYQTLCFDIQQLHFVIYQDHLATCNSTNTNQTFLPQGWLSSTVRSNENLVKNLEVSIKPRNSQANEHFRFSPAAEIFYPKVMAGPPPKSHFVLDATVIPFVRYHIGYRNPGHHGWQELVSIYTLIESFGMQNENNILLDAIYSPLGDSYYRGPGHDMMDKIGSKLMGHHSYADRNPHWYDGEFDIKIFLGNDPAAPMPKSNLICPKFTLTGMGQVGSHATHFRNGTHLRSGKLLNESDIVPYHHGDGGFFWRMRQFMMKNVGIADEDPAILASQPAQIIFAIKSSTREPRASMPLDQLMAQLQPKYDSTQVNMTTQVMHSYTIEEQVQMISTAKAIFMPVGGATFPSIFLPRGSHLVLFYVESLLDWDYWTNIPQIHVHWIPYQHLNDTSYLPSFEMLMSEILEDSY